MRKISEKEKQKIIKEFGHYTPTKEELIQKIIESQKRLNEVLKGAYDIAPGEEEKKELIKIGEKVSIFQSNVKKVFSKK